jgi:cell wall assembly regulator SMI1
MEYRALFNTVRQHLKRLGVESELVAGARVIDKALDKIERKLSIKFPGDLRELYLALGDGFVFSWKDTAREGKPFAAVAFPTLSDLAGLYKGWRQMALYTPEAAEKYGFPYTADPVLAKRTAASVWHWLPVLDEGNGDMICQDLVDPGCPIIFNKHDWMDGGSGDNGHFLAWGWHHFLHDWGRVCFQMPKNLWWPGCFRTGGGIEWDGDGFHEPFRISLPD